MAPRVKGIEPLPMSKSEPSVSKETLEKHLHKSFILPERYRRLISYIYGLNGEVRSEKQDMKWIRAWQLEACIIMGTPERYDRLLRDICSRAIDFLTSATLN